VILKRFIIRYWFKFFFGCAVILGLLVLVSNIVVELLRGEGTLIEILVFRVLEFPKWINRILPVSTLMATLFSLDALKSKNELTAILASGFSRKDFLKIILGCSFFVAAFQMLNSFYFEPVSKKYRLYELDYSHKFRGNSANKLISGKFGGDKFWYKGENYIVSFRAFDKNLNSMNKVNVFYFADDAHAVNGVLKADKSVYSSGYDWEASNVLKYEKLYGGKFPQIIKSENDSLKLGEKAESFKTLDEDITTLDFFKLYKYLKSIRKLGISTHEYDYFFYNKLMSPLLCIIFSMVSMGALFSPLARISSFGKNVIFSIVFSIVFWSLDSLFSTLGVNGALDPALAIGIMPGMCAVFIGYLLYTNRLLK
jgi:lipopolysaccharide export system permease protein